MSRTSIATPCPAPTGLSSLPIPVQNRRLSTASNGSLQDDTAELEYTRAIQLEYPNAKPRRRSTFHKREKKQAAVTIFEDVIEDEELVVRDRREIGGSTLLGKPAQRMPIHAVRKHEAVETQSQPLPAPRQAERRSSIAPQATCKEDEPEQQFRLQENADGADAEKKIRGGLKKEPRRRTIFIPTEDTTILTIHPGANTTERLDDTFQLPNIIPQQPQVQQQQLEARPAAKKPRMSLAVAPKRLPLQHVMVNENNVSGMDIVGKNGGKENVPPQAEARNGEKKANLASHSQTASHFVATSKLFEPTAASRARQTVTARHAVPLPNASNGMQGQRDVPSQASPRIRKERSDIRAGVSLRPSPPRLERKADARRASVQIEFEGSKQPAPGRGPGPNERRVEAKTARLQQYPVLSENLAQPELYEDSWLSHQEVALTELANQIFSSAQSKPEQWEAGNKSLRERLIQIYHQPQVTTLHRRLKASLLYGALSMPRDLSRSPPNPAQDIGLRKRFLSFWLDSYDLESLCVAAEVVFGRQLPRKGNVGTGISDTTLDPHKNRRGLIDFLETFLVEVNDVEEPDEERGDEPNGRWRKMVLRSLMLIWLLDQAKALNTIHGCLFKRGSPRKTSVAMLHALAGMLILSLGDITRALRHLDYEVSHVQDPLDEVNYCVDNLAVDLRDGILLTRLVEILLFSPNRLRHAEAKGDATVTIEMPDLTILESALHDVDEVKCPRILSQHLKMPCLGRAQKTFNVQIAVSALHDHGRLGRGTNEITADDIVDGHREKTLSFLWSLVSTHGLEQLVDFMELTANIKRIAGATIDIQTSTANSDFLPQSVQESLLKKWASAYAVQQGLRISNLTTSFADGKVYAAILGAFSDHVHTGPKSRSSSMPNGARVEAQLQALGCSNAFIKQVRSANGTIPSRKTTISNLAFLASRLLPLARQHNAARMIQRAFRLRRSRTIASQRTALMRLADACATVVQTQQRLISAATVLQRAWRAVLDARIKTLNSDVALFQAVAKSWSVRRRVQRIVSGDLPRNYSLRVMGGW